jgi:hypothetical protein
MDLGVVLANVDAHCLVFVITLLPPCGVSLSPHCYSCMGIVFSSWLFLVSALCHRLRDIRSCHVELVHSRSVHSTAYFVCSFGPARILKLNPVWNGGESILWY